jgi:hypothetical protein
MRDAAARESAARAAELDARKEAERAAPVLLAQNGPARGPAQEATTVPLVNFFSYKGVTITLGGFLAFETVYRSRNEESDIGDVFAGIPEFNAPLNHMGEFRATARQSRLAGLVQGSPDATTHLAMYAEFDFLTAPQTANNNESNSFSPRIRHFYGTADWDDFGLHVLAGQNWSMVVLNQVGENPRTELPPPAIDSQYVPGFVWTRQPQLRIWKDWDKMFYAGISIENPATTFFTGTNALPGSLHLTINAPPGSQFASVNTLSLNHIPDVIGKVAVDPNPNMHFEAFGMWREFYDRYNFTNHNFSGASAGIGAFVKILPGTLDFQGTAVYGQGVGRYGSSQLPDVTIRPDGALEPITENAELVGLTWHTTPFLDLYAFAGREEDNQKSYNLVNGAVVTPYGYGNPLYSNAGCLSETAVGACVANTREVEQITVGFWDNLYRGSYGNLRIGGQYSYTKRLVFTGIGGAPSPDLSSFFTSFRYYPF